MKDMGQVLFFKSNNKLNDKAQCTYCITCIFFGTTARVISYCKKKKKIIW